MKFVSAILFAVLLSACGREGDESAWWDNEKTIIELEHRLELAQYRLEMTATPQPGAATSTVPPEELRDGIDSMTVRKHQLTSEIANLRDGWPEFRVETLHRRRAAAMGDFSGDFHVPDGRVLRGAHITKVDDGGVSVSHETGAARLRIGDLDESQRTYFGLDAELAEIAYAEEQGQRIAYQRWHEERHAANEEERSKLAEVRREEENRLSNARLIAAANRSVAPRPLSTAIGALGETSAVSGSHYPYRRSRYYARPSIRYHYYQPAPAPCAHRIPIWGSSSPFRSPCHSFTAPPAVSPINPFSPIGVEKFAI